MTRDLNEIQELIRLSMQEQPDRESPIKQAKPRYDYLIMDQ